MTSTPKQATREMIQWIESGSFDYTWWVSYRIERNGGEYGSIQWEYILTYERGALSRFSACVSRGFLGLGLIGATISGDEENPADWSLCYFLNPCFPKQNVPKATKLLRLAVEKLQQQLFPERIVYQ